MKTLDTSRAFVTFDLALKRDFSERTRLGTDIIVTHFILTIYNHLYSIAIIEQ